MNFKPYSCLFLVVLLASMSGCSSAFNSAQESLKGATDGINQTTERLEEAVSPIGKNDNCNLVYSDALKAAPIDFGSCTLSYSNTANNNKLTLFVKSVDAYNSVITCKAFNDENVLIGEATTQLSIKADEAQYISFIFDTQVNLTTQTRIEVE
ncbi:MAG: hypothetical protein WBA16_05790 [Nonlabens sp.]